MYCKHCGRAVEDHSSYCSNCGTRLDNTQKQTSSDDSPNIGFAVLGFFFPIVGLILFLVYEGKKPKRAKSAGKGALIGFITKIVLSIVIAILYFVFTASLFGKLTNDLGLNIPAIGGILHETSWTNSKTLLFGFWR